MMLRRWILSLALLVVPLFAYADWAADRDASPGFVKITTLATVIDEAVPFVYVKLSDLPASFHTYMDDAGDTTGRTIRVSTGDGATELACYVVGINTTTDTGGLFFLATGISASDNVYYRIYSGNAALTLPTAAASNELVFASYAGAYMPGMTTEDLTSGNRDLTAVNSPGTVASDYEGITAAEYNGTDEYHKYEGTPAVTDWPVTFEAIASPDNTTQTGMILVLANSGQSSASQAYLFAEQSNDKFYFANKGADNVASYNTSSTTYSATTNYYIVGTRDDDVGIGAIYVNGGITGTNSTTLNAPSWDRTSIGVRFDSAADNYFDGNVAVALLSSSVRSANYVSTMQDNWLGDLYSVGVWETNWETARNGSAGYVTVTTLATAVDEAVPFCVVYLSDLPADFHTAMSTASDTDGKTIRVSNSDGTTQLACVPIGVNTGTDTGCLIFLGTGMSASVDVDYRIYVGNAALTMPAASAGEQLVFAAYAGVYFPGVDTRDWTAGGRTLTAVNSPGTAASGYEGVTAATYNGSNQYHYNSGTQGVTSGPPHTQEVLLSMDSLTTSRIFCLARYSFGSNYSLLEYVSGLRLSLQGNSGSVSTATSSGLGALSTNTYYYFAGTRDTFTTGTTRTYRNGSAGGTNTTDLTATPTYDSLSIGALRFNSTTQNYMPGKVAVALLSDSERSADYVATMQDNWAGTLYSAGAWTANSSTCNSGSTGWVLFGSVGQSTSAGADWATLSNALVDDADAATVSLDDGGVYESEYLNFTNITYGTQPPIGADSYTISARIKRSGQTNTGKEINDLTVQFIDETGTRVGTNMAATAVQWPSTAANAVPDYVFTGFTPDGGDFDADSGIALRATGINTNGATTASVLTVWIKIDWTCPSTIETASGFFGLED